MHVVGGDDLGVGTHRELRERVVARPIERITVIPQLHQNPIPTEPGDELFERVLRGRRTVAHELGGHDPLAAPGSSEPTSARVGRGRRELLEAQLRRTLLAAHLRVADGASQRRVPARTLREDQHVLAMGIGEAGVPSLSVRAHGIRGVPAVAVIPARDSEGQLGAEDGGQTDRACRLGETHHAVEAVVVGDREAGQAEPVGLLGQLLGVARAVEERKIRMAVQLRITRPDHFATLKSATSRTGKGIRTYVRRPLAVSGGW